MASRAMLVLTAGVIGFSVVCLPWWSAARVEAARQAQFQSRVAGALVADQVPACPVPLEPFLQKRAAQSHRSSGWMPGCRIAEPSPGRVAVVAPDESSLRQCQNASRWGASIVCQFDPEVPFLAQPDAVESTARMKVEQPSGDSILWISSVPLPWGAHLVARHRLWIVYAWLALSMVSFVAITERRSRAMRMVYVRPLTGAPPRVAEWLLLGWIGHKAQPDDLREEYLAIKQEGKRNAALWYWRQVSCSLPALILMRFLDENSKYSRTDS